MMDIAKHKHGDGLKAFNATTAPQAKHTHSRDAVNDAIAAYVQAARRTQVAIERAHVHRITVQEAFTTEMEAKEILSVMFESLSVVDTESLSVAYTEDAAPVPKKALCGDTGGRRKRDGNPCSQPAQPHLFGRCRFHKLDLN